MVLFSRLIVIPFQVDSMNQKARLFSFQCWFVFSVVKGS